MQKSLITAITSAITAYLELEQLNNSVDKKPDGWWLLGQLRQKRFRISGMNMKSIPGSTLWRYRQYGLK